MTTSLAHPHKLGQVFGAHVAMCSAMVATRTRGSRRDGRRHRARASAAREPRGHARVALFVLSGPQRCAQQGRRCTVRGKLRMEDLERDDRVGLELRGSADPGFLGDPDLHNPEDLLLIALSSCHMLTYLALCARQRLRVVS